MQSRVELEQENQRIEAELVQVREALLARESALQKKDAALQKQTLFIEQLKEALILARNARFASSSESLRFEHQESRSACNACYAVNSVQPAVQ